MTPQKHYRCYSCWVLPTWLTAAKRPHGQRPVDDEGSPLMRTLMTRLKRIWHTPVEFYGIDHPEPQAGSWHGLLLFVILLVVLGLLWLIRYLPERTYLVHMAQPPNGAMLLHHLANLHPTEARPYLKHMETEDIGMVAAEAYEVIEEET